MPIYEYICHSCKEKEEFLHKVNEEGPKICPHCLKEGFLERIVSNSAFHLKGGGWYKDLYASKKSEEKTIDKKNTDTVTNNNNKKEDKKSDKQ